MADTADEVRELAGVWVDDDPKLYRFLLNYAALLEAMEVRSGNNTPIQRDFVQALKQHAENLRCG